MRRVLSMCILHEHRERSRPSLRASYCFRGWIGDVDFNALMMREALWRKMIGVDANDTDPKPRGRILESPEKDWEIHEIWQDWIKPEILCAIMDGWPSAWICGIALFAIHARILEHGIAGVVIDAQR